MLKLDVIKYSVTKNHWRRGEFQAEVLGGGALFLSM